MRFVKMHGLGNDYVYLDAVTAPLLERHPDLAGLARRVSDRHTGIGSDGLIVVCPPTVAGAAVRMRMFNADGSESEMCGNGVRCVAKFAVDRLGMTAQPLMVQTGRGVVSIEWVLGTGEGADGRVAGATVDMGEPVLEPQRVPVDLSRVQAGSGVNRFVLPEVKGLPEFVAVSMGNPHVVLFDSRPLRQPDATRFMQTFGPIMERHAAFPARTNVHLVHAATSTEATMLTWERGAGLTRACGTGACAALVAGALTDRLSREATMHLPGGDLKIRWDEWSNHVFMTGPAADVFEGDWADVTLWRPTPRPTIVTERLVLRPFERSDAARVALLAGAKEIASTTLLIPHPYREVDALNWIKAHDDVFVSGKGVDLAICLKDSSGRAGELVGAIGLVRSARHQRAEVGYWLGVPFWNKGYTTEATKAVIRYAFEVLTLHRVDSHHYARNPASGRVLEKAGLKREGVHPGHVLKWGAFEDAVMYGVMNPAAGAGPGGGGAG